MITYKQISANSRPEMDGHYLSVHNSFVCDSA